MKTSTNTSLLARSLVALSSITSAKYRHPPRSPASTVSATTSSSYWHPTPGTTWNIDLSTTWTSTTTNVSVLDLDLFSTSASTITSLSASSTHTICYFSAGSFEDWRPDASNFSTSEYSHPLDGWPGEYWLNTSSLHVRDAMAWRLDLAKSKGCAGVDPDNTDGYDNEPTGFNLTVATATDYVNWLADQAHARGMAVGLKNSAAVIPNVLSRMQWAVNEQCVQYDECDGWDPFVDAGKLVFGIEYPDGAPDVSAETKEKICGDQQRKGLSTLLKEMDLNVWSYACPLDEADSGVMAPASANASSGSAAFMVISRQVFRLVAVALLMTVVPVLWM